MKPFATIVYTDSNTLPPLSGKSFFHSEALFRIYEKTPRLKPYMAVVCNHEGKELAHLLAVVRMRASFFPPLIYMHARIHGEGDYAEHLDAAKREELFGEMVRMLTAQLQLKVLYVEISNLDQKMFAYKHLRQAGFFPVKWMSIHNSLHSKRPEERVSNKLLQRVEKAREKGVIAKQVETDEEFADFIRLLRRHNRLKLRRFIPHEQFFRHLRDANQGKLFITYLRDKAIGCCACALSGNNIYLWYSAFLRKTYLVYHPDTFTVWNTIKWAYEEHYDHIVFMDVGLPFMQNPFRDFILSFGGKPVSTLRWFRLSFGWLNKWLEFFFTHL